MISRLSITLYVLCVMLALVCTASSYSYIYGIDDRGETGQTIVATSDGGVLVAGSISPGLLFVKLDSAGNTQWQRGTSGANDSGQVISAAETSDGDFVAAAVVVQQIVV